MTCTIDEPDTNASIDTLETASSNAAATAGSGGSSSSSKSDRDIASSDARASATPAGQTENVQRGCGVPVQKRLFIVELACPKCNEWEPFASSDTFDEARYVVDVYPEYRRRIVGPESTTELPIEDWIPDNEREEANIMATKEQKEVRELECNVSKAEIEDRKNKLVAVDQDINRESAEKSNENAARGRTIRNLKKERDNLLDAIQNGKEKRKVDCFWRMNDRLHKKELIRADTGAVVVEEPQTLEDKQEDLFDTKPKKGSKAAEQIAAEQKKVDAAAKKRKRNSKKNGAAEAGA